MAGEPLEDPDSPNEDAGGAVEGEGVLTWEPVFVACPFIGLDPDSDPVLTLTPWSTGGVERKVCC